MSFGGFTLGVIGIVISYVVIAVLLLSLNLTSRWVWWVKALAIVVTAGFFLESYLSLNSVLGFATEQPPPERFQILWMTTREPDKKTGDAGAIFLWADELGSNNRPVGNPRAYRLPYTREMHKESASVRQKIGEEDMDLMGTAQKKGDETTKSNSSDPNAPGAQDLAPFKIEGMPLPPLPSKDTPPPAR